MPGPIVIPLTYQVAIEMQSGGQPVVNVIGIRAGFSNVQEVATAVKAAWEKSGGPLKARPSTVTMVGYRVTDLSNPAGAVFFLPSNTSGGTTAQLATNGSCALISYSGGTRSRSSSGRMYHGPLSEPDIDADGRTLTVLKRGALSAVYQVFRQDLAGDNYEWVVISRKLQQAFPAGVPIAQVIIATQRRRIRGR